jgi:hypothetical protein|tara:strand:+ start:177 stop:491 length:315 start_codon:yes stop_codon:yes gene_type:complete
MDKEMTIDDLKDLFGEVLIFCCEHGMEAPFALEAVGAADNILAFQYVLIDDQGTLAGQSLSENYEDETFRTPINITIKDQHGEVANVSISPRGTIDSGDVTYLH